MSSFIWINAALFGIYNFLIHWTESSAHCITWTNFNDAEAGRRCVTYEGEQLVKDYDVGRLVLYERLKSVQILIISL
jgi:hypothetical protein